VEVRYDIELGERAYSNSIVVKKVYKDIMYVKNVIKKEKQLELSTLIISIVGKSIQKRDMYQKMVSYYVSSVIMPSIVNMVTNLSPNQSVSLIGWGSIEVKQ
jgi:ribosomal protein L22